MNLYQKLTVSILISSLIGCSNTNVQSGWTNEQIVTIASQVKPNEIVLYGTEGCPYCKQAAAWLKQNNFKFKDCDLDKSNQCANEYRTFGANGVPFITVNRSGKVKMMNDGFNSDELLTLLSIEN